MYLTEKSNSKYAFITGLKGIGCLGVMIGHYAGIVKYISWADFDTDIFSFLSMPPFCMWFDESFWLQLFFLSSGFLLAQSKVENVTMLISKIINRFLRLGIPVFLATAVIWVIWITFGMHNDETTNLFKNDWFQNAYTSYICIYDVLLSPFYVLLLGVNKVNSPYWVLRNMFIASVLIYCVIFIDAKLIKRESIRCFVACVSVLISCFSDVVLVCVLGFIVARHTDYILCVMRKVNGLCVGTIVFCFICSTFFPNKYSAIILFGVLIILAPAVPPLDIFLRNRLFLNLERISFGIYSFHWPIMCSVGAYILLKSWYMGIVVALVFSSTASLFITIIISYIYTILTEIVFTIIKKRRF